MTKLARERRIGIVALCTLPGSASAQGLWGRVKDAATLAVAGLLVLGPGPAGRWT